MGFPRPRHAPPVHQFGQLITGNPRDSDGRPIRDRSTSRTSRQHDGIMVALSPYASSISPPEMEPRSAISSGTAPSRSTIPSLQPPGLPIFRPPGHPLPPRSTGFRSCTRLQPASRKPASWPPATKETLPLKFTGFSHIRRNKVSIQKSRLLNTAFADTVASLPSFLPMETPTSILSLLMETPDFHTLPPDGNPRLPYSPS